MKKSLLPVLLLSMLFSCNETDDVDCSAVLCTGPATLAFEVLQNGQNVFDDPSVSTEDIRIIGSFPSAYEFQVEASNYNGGTNLLFVQQIDWEIRTYNFNLVINSIQSEDVSVTIALSTGDCCAGIPQISQFTVNGAILENPNRVVTLNLP